MMTVIARVIEQKSWEATRTVWTPTHSRNVAVPSQKPKRQTDFYDVTILEPVEEARPAQWPRQRHLQKGVKPRPLPIRVKRGCAGLEQGQYCEVAVHSLRPWRECVWVEADDVHPITI